MATAFRGRHHDTDSTFDTAFVVTAKSEARTKYTKCISEHGNGTLNEGDDEGPQ